MQGAEAKGKAMHALGWSKNLTEYPTKSLGGILRNVQEDRDVWAKHHIFTKKRKRNAHAFLFLVGKDGFEPPKSKDSRFTVCPIWPLWNLPEMYPLMFQYVKERVFSFSSLLSDSNQRPRDYKSRALAN